MHALADGPGSWLAEQGLLDRPSGEDGLLDGAWGVALEGSYGWSPVIAHRGVLHLRLRTEGAAAHASTPHLGVNATLQMARALLALDDEGLREELTAPLETGLLGPPTLALGTTIAGGGVQRVELLAGGPEIERGGVNVVPSWCEATIDIRFPPARTGGDAAAAEHLLTTLRDRLDARLDPALGTWSLDLLRGVGPSVAVAPSWEEAARHPLVRLARERARQVLGYEPDLETAPGGTDATVLVHRARIPTLVELGPGGGRSHDANEFVEVEGIVEGAKVLALLAVDLLGLR